MAIVELEAVSRRFPNGVEALSEVSLTVADGELFVLLGPSGSGKTTLLRLLAGLDSATSGTIKIGGRDVTGLPPRERSVAMVFQDAALYPYLSVFDNLAFGLRARRVPSKEIKARIEPVAASLGLEGVLDRKPGTLSGGQRQRVAFGRAIVRRPAVFLLDEPLSRLDAPLRASVRADLIDLHQREGSTILCVTHDQSEALAIAQRIGLMERGKLVQTGRPADVYQTPATRFVATFLGNPPMNFLPCPGNDWGLNPPRNNLVLGIRPEDVTLANDPVGDASSARWTWLPDEAELLRIEYQGHESVATVLLQGHPLCVRCAGLASISAQRLRVGLDKSRVSWFDARTGLRERA